MKQIIINKEFLNKKGAPHEKAVVVDEILKVVGISKTYGYGYWLRKIKEFEQCGGNLNSIYGFLKEIKDIHGKYSKGGILTNTLKKWIKETKR